MTNVVKGCPGEVAGIQAGDKITQIDGEAAAGMAMDYYIEAMGQPLMTLQVERTGVAQPFTVRLSVPK